MRDRRESSAAEARSIAVGRAVRRGRVGRGRVVGGDGQGSEVAREGLAHDAERARVVTRQRGGIDALQPHRQLGSKRVVAAGRLFEGDVLRCGPGGRRDRDVDPVAEIPDHRIGGFRGGDRGDGPRRRWLEVCRPAGGQQREPPARAHAGTEHGPSSGHLRGYTPRAISATAACGGPMRRQAESPAGIRRPGSAVLLCRRWTSAGSPGG